MKIFINPGHSPNGIPDPGTINPVSGRRESDIANHIGLMLREELLSHGYEVQATQSDSLAAVCFNANAWGADLFISIHCNASNEHRARGTETWYFNNSHDGRILAEIINRNIVATVPNITNRGIKEGNFYVLRETEMPAVLIELAFLDNPHDEDLLLKYDKEFARAIMHGINQFFV